MSKITEKKSAWIGYLRDPENRQIPTRLWNSEFEMEIALPKLKLRKDLTLARFL